MSPLKNEPPYNVARFAGFFIESLLTGVYVVHFYLYIEGVYTRSRQFRTKTFLPMFGLGLLVFLVVIGHFTVLAVSTFIALANLTETDTPIDQRGYLTISSGLNKAYNGLFICIPFLADTFLICRLYMVWDRNRWIIAPPIALCITLLVTASLATKRFVASVDSIFQYSSKWIIVSFALTFVCNTYCTFFIALRVFLAQRRNNQLRMTSLRSRIQPWVDILIRSAGLYCILIMFCLVFSVVESDALYLTIAATSPVVGISFCMIVSRADAEKEQNLLHQGTHHTHSTGAPLLHPNYDTHLGGQTDIHTTFRSTLIRRDDDGSTMRDSAVTTNFAPLAEKNRDSDVTSSEA